jgi:hypothetical protein
MNEIKRVKEKQINDYISNIIIDENEIDVDKIKEDLGFLLGEKPGIELEYISENLLLEDGKSKKRIKKLESINIYYTFTTDDGSYNFGNLKYLTN